MLNLAGNFPSKFSVGLFSILGTPRELPSSIPTDCTNSNDADRTSYTASATFQCVINTVLEGLKWQSCLVDLDDVVVFSRDFDEHLRRLRAELQVIQTAGLSLEASMCWYAYGGYSSLTTS